MIVSFFTVAFTEDKLPEKRMLGSNFNLYGRQPYPIQNQFPMQNQYPIHRSPILTQPHPFPPMPDQTFRGVPPYWQQPYEPPKQPAFVGIVGYSGKSVQ